MKTSRQPEIEPTARTRRLPAGVLIGVACAAALAAVAIGGSGPLAPDPVPTAMAQGQNPWPCDNTAYVTRHSVGPGNTALLRVDLEGDEFTFTTLGTYQDAALNGLAFRKEGRFMYAWDNSAPRELVRIERDDEGDAQFVGLGAPEGLEGQTFNGGDALPNGNLLLTDSNTEVAYVIDPSDPPSVVRGPLAAPRVGADVAVNHANLRVYGRVADANEVVLYDLGEDELSINAVVGPGRNAGAQWFDPLGADGRLILYANTVGAPDNALWAIDVASDPPTQTRLGDAAAASNVDGAACHTLSAPRCTGVDATLVGTRFDEVLAGTSGTDVIVARPGNDEVLAGTGDDLVCAREGRNEVRGGHGDDEVHGGPHANGIFGGPGRDELFGGRGPDTISGGPGRDRMHGGPAADVLRGADGGDIIGGWKGNDELGGGAGHDRLNAGPGTDRCKGGPGNDRLRGCES